MEKPPINWTNMLLFTLTPLGALTLVPLYGFLYGYDLFEWLMFILLMGFCGISITAGYHRLWAHKSYKANSVVRFIFALGGACALQNDIFHWVSDHRRHHRYVDDNSRDPYSAGRGFWFSHMGWILRNYDSGKEDFSNIRDIKRDPVACWQHRHYLKLVLATNIGLPLLLGVWHGDIIASLLLAGVLRLVLSHHVTWMINSVAHIWGRQNYSDKSSARDNPLLALITYGEGYHNFHHTFQWDYRNGVKWWHFDPTKWLIRTLALLGLARDLKRCPVDRIERARLDMQFRRASERCRLLEIPETLRLRLEQEYRQFQRLLQQWSEHRQAWYEARSEDIQQTLGRWEILTLRDRYKAIHFQLKAQKRRWQEMLRALSGTELAT